jgi:hypothetical protein
MILVQFSEFTVLRRRIARRAASRLFGDQKHLVGASPARWMLWAEGNLAHFVLDLTRLECSPLT